MNINEIISLEISGFINENVDSYSSWKRKNVTLRGIKNHEISYENGIYGSFGKGLYTVPLSNKAMAKQYGDVYYVINAIPKKPKIVNNLNDAEMFVQGLVMNFCKQYGEKYNKKLFEKNTTIEDEMLKLGYDGLIIKGREMVNYKPGDYKYFSNENALYNYYEDFIKGGDLNENNTVSTTLNDILKTIPQEVIGAIDEFQQTKAMTIFHLNEHPDVSIYLYDTSINKFQTASTKYPKNIFINFDYLSDIPKVVLNNDIGNNIYINVYYAILHELGHILEGHDGTNRYKTYDDYINSPEERAAMEYADKWLRSFSNNLNEATATRDKEFYDIADNFYEKMIVELNNGNYESFDSNRIVFMASEINPQLRDLLVLFIDKNSNSTNTPFGNKSAKGNYSFGTFPNRKKVIVVPNLDDSMNPSNGIFKDSFIHEFTHYLDFVRSKGKFTNFNDKTTMSDYYNSPSEYNAYYQEAANYFVNLLKDERVLNTIRNKYPTFDSFFHWMLENVFRKQFVANLNDKNKLKIEKRIYNIYSEYIQNNKT